MNKKAIIFLLTIVYLTGNCSALCDFESDALYKAARGYLIDNDLKNSLRSAYRARESYEDCDNPRGLQITDNLILEITSSLNDPQIAGYYYSIAGDYYILATSSQCDIVNLERTSSMAGKAKEIYKRIEGLTGTEGVIRSEDLMKKSVTSKNECINNRRIEGEELFNQAKSLYFTKDYISAKIVAQNASEIFSSIPDPLGITKTANLITSIEKELTYIKVNAATSYGQALKYYAANDLEKALEFSIESQKLYRLLGEDEGVVKNMNLITRIHSDQTRSVDKLMKEASKLFEEAEIFFTVHDYDNASQKARQALNIYTMLKDEAFKGESHLRPKQQIQTNLYRSYEREVNGLLVQIKKEWGTDFIEKTAGVYYKKAQEQYLQNKLNEALSYAHNSRNLYADLGNYVGIAQSDTLINQIKNRMQLRTQAEIFLKNAKGFFNVAEFDSAYVDASKARSIYADMDDYRKKEDVDNFLKEIRDGSDKLTNADAYIQKSESYYDILDYETSLKWAQEANKLYVDINYSIGISESRLIITESEKYLEEEWTKLRNLTIGLGLVVTLLIIIIVSYTQKKTRMEDEIDEEKSEEAERRRKYDEESILKMERETKERVEDELRKLIEQERLTRDETEDSFINDENI